MMVTGVESESYQAAAYCSDLWQEFNHIGFVYNTERYKIMLKVIKSKDKVTSCSFHYIYNIVFIIMYYICAY